MPLGAEALLPPPAPPPPTGPHDARYTQPESPQTATTAQEVGQIIQGVEGAVATYLATPGSSIAEKLKSRKLWAAIFGVVLSIVFAAVGAIPHAEALKSGTILGVVYVAAEGAVDAMSALGLGG